MNSIVNAFLAMGLLVVIVLIVYLVDRINSLERETRRLTQQHAPPPMPALSDPWAGLSGKSLWDAMTGRPPSFLSAVALQDLRQNYEVVLYKHIHALFDEGVQDARLGVNGEPRNSRLIRTAQGEVESWLPPPQANTLYKCGLDSIALTPENAAQVSSALDEAGRLLFEKTQMPQSQTLSSSLLHMPAPTPPGPAGGAGTQPY